MAKTSTVSPEQFIKAWQIAETKAAFCEKSGLSIGAASSRATHYRKQGVKLKNFPRGNRSPRLDYDVLKKLAVEHAPKNGDTKKK